MLCTSKDKKDLFEFLNKRQAENTFFIGDIENFGFESDFMDMWKFETEGKITTVLLKYHKFYLVSAENYEHLEEVAKIVNADSEATMLSGLDEVIEKMTSMVKFKSVKKTFLANLTKETFKDVESDFVPVKATVDDKDDLFEFLMSIEEFENTERNRESFDKGLSAGTKKIYYIKEDDKIVSTAAITAENSANGMMVSVATDKDYRKKGYAKACVSTMCKEMIDNGKSVVLFYDNPDAAKLYKMLGFVDIGRWYMGTIR